MPKTKLVVERTAMHPFTLDGAPVRRGQVVSLNPFQLNNLVKSGCVALSDDDDALVPKAELPPTQTAPSAIVGDKGQVVQLTADETAKLAGTDQGLADLVATGDLSVLTSDQWDKLVAFDARYAVLRPATGK